MIPARLDPARALLMVIDLQERLLPAIHEQEAIVRRAEVMIRAALELDLPIIWTEQYRKGLGATVEPIARAIGNAAEPMEKMAFGCLDDDDIADAAGETERDQLILVGIETHVCILQTALTALEDDLEVFVAEDATGSRATTDRDTALRRMAQAGCTPVTVEMAIMELLGEAGTEDFKAILPLVKER